jgi:hypothetical protein
MSDEYKYEYHTDIGTEIKEGWEVETDDGEWRKTILEGTRIGDCFTGKRYRSIKSLNTQKETISQAKYLVELLHQKFYPENKEWRACESILGILDQINNICAGLQRIPEPSKQVAAPVSWVIETSFYK